MMDWKSFWDRPHQLYSGQKHLAAHYRRIADDMISVIPGPQARVLDYGCGEALDAARVASHCRELMLFEAVDGPRRSVASRFQGAPGIVVLGPAELANRPDNSVDLVIVNSVLQYLSDAQLDELIANARRVLAPQGRFIIADVIPPDASALGDVKALLAFALSEKFLIEAVQGLVRTAFSDYVTVRKTLGLATHTSEAMLKRLQTAGFQATRRTANLGMNPGRMTFVAHR
jgi:ubiquinone/menaquinone biosynthesis C-methylase UbiE